MNISDLPQGSYTPVGQPTGLNVNNLPQGSYSRVQAGATQPAPINQSPSESIWHTLASYAGNVGAAYNSGVNQFSQGAGQINQGGGPVAGLEGGLKMLSGVATAAAAPIAPALAPVGTAIQAGENAVASIPAVQQLSNSLPVTDQTLARGAQDLGNVSNIAGSIAGASKLAETLPKMVDTLKNINYGAPSTPTEPLSLDKGKVSDLYNRAIRPTVAGKSTDAQLQQASSRVVSGLQAIADNKPNLSFTNADGEVTTNATPKSVDQLSQAIGQTKASIFKQYDALAKQAGEQGVSVDAPKIASELDPVINSKSLQLANPSAVKYAQSVQTRFTDAGQIDAQTAQDVIQHYNDSLKAFYRNPSYDTASKAGIDALIANKLRSALDEGISGATGEQYQALKRQYGALASMEKDVTHRSIVWARQNNVGLGANLSNVASGAELVRGLVTMNPADIAVSGAIKGIQKYVQYLNNPDVGVSKIFSEIGKSSRPAIENTSAPIESKPVSSSLPQSTSVSRK